MKDWRCWAWISTAIMVCAIAGCNILTNKQTSEVNQTALKNNYEQGYIGQGFSLSKEWIKVKDTDEK